MGDLMVPVNLSVGNKAVKFWIEVVLKAYSDKSAIGSLQNYKKGAPKHSKLFQLQIWSWTWAPRDTSNYNELFRMFG